MELGPKFFSTFLALGLGANFASGMTLDRTFGSARKVGKPFVLASI
jgi:hypothetical protein